MLAENEYNKKIAKESEQKASNLEIEIKKLKTNYECLKDHEYNIIQDI